MTECYCNHHNMRRFGYKRNVRGKNYLGEFEVVERDNKFEIWCLKIYEPYRCKGYATRMLKEFIAQFKSDKPLSLYVLKGNKIAIHLYEKVGFVIIGQCSFEPDAYEMQYKGG